MENSFLNKSKNIANDYIQSVVFLDDRAYKSNVDEAKPNNSFDALRITQSFAKSEKLCAVYQPQSDEDIEKFKIITTKADAIVLDWEINFPKVVEVGNEEDDDDHEAGLYTKSIIKSALFDEDKLKESSKIIVVYTGDYAILKNILNEIYAEVFTSNQLYVVDEKDLSISYSNFKVLVRAKVAEINNATNKHLESFMVSYEDMPTFILDHFTKLTSGLLSNFALLSLTILRKNSSKILGLFSKEMDSAYLGHKSIIPKQEDAEDLLIELFGDTVKDLLYYVNVNAKIREELINSWIDENSEEEDFTDAGKTFKKERNILKSFFTSNDEDAKSRFNNILSHIDKGLKNKILENPTKLFTKNSEIFKSLERDENFAKLTHHKSLFIPKNTLPKLTLGTLIKSNKSPKYYICIQQRCDSVRIPKNTDRKFLFIPLTVSDGKFDVLTPDGIKLQKDKGSFAIRTIKFKCSNDLGIIQADKNKDGKFIFQQFYTNPEDEDFEWILDLKDLHSQRIIIDYTSQLSRVGLDESEWHRRFLS